MPATAFRTATICLFAWGILAAQEPAPDLDQSLKASRASFSKGDYEPARKSIEEAWKLAENIPSIDPRRYEILKQFSAVLAAMRAYADAENYLQLAINWRENTNGLDDPKVADDLIELVALCRGLHDFARGLAVQNRIMLIHIKSGGPQSPLLADDSVRSAQLYLDLKDLDKAVRAFQTALSFREWSVGSDHPTILPDLDHLGSALITVRDYERAEEIYRRALILRERLYGPTHADLLATLDGLAYSLFGQKKYDDAEPVYKRLLALWETSAGPFHPMVALMLDKMTTFYREQQKWEQAKEAAARAIALRETFLASGLAQEAGEALTHGGKDEARRLYRRALAVLDRDRADLDPLRKQLQSSLEELDTDRPKPDRLKPFTDKGR